METIMEDRREQNKKIRVHNSVISHLNKRSSKKLQKEKKGLEKKLKSVLRKFPALKDMFLD